jgi:cytochrome c peroxidase
LPDHSNLSGDIALTTISSMSLATRRSPTAGAIAAVVVSLGLGATEASALTPGETALIALGKNVFFDDKLSHPSNKQACASCHNAARGWVLPNSKINAKTVVAPGAAPHAVGSIKTPSNAYASFSPPFAATSPPVIPPFRGGNFWDGRAEGCGATNGVCPVGTGSVSATIRPTDLPDGLHAGYLGPTADQALNPFPNTVEQNIRQKVGLSSHVPAINLIGLVKTPTLRNVAKGLDGSFVKAFAHNGYFKTLKGIVHFYNTRDSLRARTSPSSGKCEERGLLNATEAEALKFDCWPPAEFPETQAGFVVGNLGLTVAEENAIVAYMTTLIDKSTPTPP